MMQINQLLIGFLAAMADSDFSAPFYIRFSVRGNVRK